MNDPSGIDWSKATPVDDPSGINWDDAKKRLDVINQQTPREYAEAQERKFREQINPATGGFPGQRVVEGLGSFWPSVGLATRQAAASLGYGDKEALAREAAEKKRLDAPLDSTFGGQVGKFLPDLGLGLVGGNVGKAGMAMVPSLARNAATGAVLNAIQPSENYDLGTKLWQGAAQGGVSELAGQTAKKAALPFSAPQTGGAAENAALLESAGLPNPRISTRTGEGLPRSMSDALEQIPVLGSKVKTARDNNLEWFTRQQTKDAGLEVGAITDSSRRAMSDNMDKVAATFKAGSDASALDVIRSLQTARNTLGQNLAATGQTAALNRFDDAISALRGNRSLPATDLMKRRELATSALHAADNTAEREAYRAIRDAYDDAFVAANPTMRSDFAKYKAEYGHFKDVIAAADKGLAGDRLIPRNMRSSMDFGGTVAQTPGERLVQAASQSLTPPPGGWERAKYTAALLGAPLTLGGLGGFATNPGFGTALGVGTAASLWNALSRKPTSPETAELIRQMTTGTANAGMARFFGQ